MSIEQRIVAEPVVWHVAALSPVQGGRFMTDARHRAGKVREAVIQSAVTAYEDAAMQGLCSEGAWEVALTAMRKLDLRPLTSQYRESGQA